MKTRTECLHAVAAMLAVLLTPTACGERDTVPDATPAPEVADALAMADELGIEWGAAPWSPKGWPLKVGDKISEETFRQLSKRFSGDGWLNGMATQWVDDLPFGALIYLGNVRDVESGTPHIYHGHFPTKVDRVYKALPPDFLPPHLRGRNVDHLYRTPDGYGVDWGLSPNDLRKRWHEPWLRKYGDGGKGGGS